jgi:zinc protease
MEEFSKMRHKITRLVFSYSIILILLFSVGGFAVGSEIQIPEFAYENFRLDNGLEVFVFEDDRIPLVELSIFYKIGAIDEEEGLSGIAHFLEHVMFLGTEALPKGQLDEVIKSVGGQNNAMTSYDFTYYYSQVPSSKLELVMALEADRMVNLKFDPEEIEREREVIRQERRSGIENNVVSVGLEMLLAQAFPGSSLNHLVVGWMEDINRITVEDLKRYYDTYYVPNNAVLVVAGDVDVEEVKGLTEKYFGHLERGEIKRPEFVVAPQEAEIEEIYELYTNVPITLMLYKIPPGNHPDSLAIEILLDILINNESSRVTQELQNKESLILETGAVINSIRVPGFALVYYVPTSEEILAETREAFDREVARIINDGIEQEEFQAVKKAVEKGLILMQRDIENMAFTIGLSQLSYNDPDLYRTQLVDLNRLTEAEIIAIAGKYFTPENRAVGHIVPVEE